MSEIIQDPRHACALGGQQTVVAIERAIPILHAGPGCGSKLHRGLAISGGYQGAGYAGADAMPCTNMIEKDVVFGGVDKLRDVIEGTLEVMDGDFYVVLTGCTAGIVGDDVGSVVGEFQQRGVPIVYVETAGFRGDAYEGHEMVLEAIIEQYLKPAGRVRKGLINVFASVPRHDPFWEGDLNELKRLLAGIGLEANILFGYSAGGVKALDQIPEAEFNLVVSPYIGLKTVELLKKRFGTPFLHIPVPPVGGNETSLFLRTVAEYAGVYTDEAKAFIQREEDAFYHYLVRSADLLTEFQMSVPSRFFNVNDAAYSLAFSKFLVNELGYFPIRQFITENVPEEYEEPITGYFKDLRPGISSEVSFTQDGGEIQDAIQKEGRGQKLPLVLGSFWEIDTTKQIGGLFLSVGTPIIDRLVLHHNYLGYSGGLNLVEDIYNQVLAKHRD